jgi:cell wall-associated NlpC family hydrolase
MKHAKAGDIVVTAKGSEYGHTGIVVENNEIISNSSHGFCGSACGTIQKNYTIDKWQRSVTPRNPSRTKAFRYIGEIRK